MHRRIGLTGGIASGKSSVAEMLERLGAVVIDADVLAREVVQPGTEGFSAVVERFGEAVVAGDGGLDRPRLGQIVFGDPRARADLEAIIHPRVRALARESEATAPPGSLVVHVIPLLVETGQEDSFDGVVVVDLPVPVQLARLRARDGLTEEQASARIAAQASRERRLAAATWVVDNSGSPEDTHRQVQALWDGFLNSLSEPDEEATCSPRSSGETPS